MMPYARLLVAQKIDSMSKNSLVLDAVSTTCVSTTGKPWGNKRGYMLHMCHCRVHQAPCLQAT